MPSAPVPANAASATGVNEVKQTGRASAIASFKG
jgi:hypothetical protein